MEHDLWSSGETQAGSDRSDASQMGCVSLHRTQNTNKMEGACPERALWRFVLFTRRLPRSSQLPSSSLSPPASSAPLVRSPTGRRIASPSGYPCRCFEPISLSSDLTSRNNSSSPAQQISGSARSRRPSPIYICPQGPCKLPPSAPSNIRTLLSSSPPLFLRLSSYSYARCLAQPARGGQVQRHPRLSVPPFFLSLRSSVPDPSQSPTLASTPPPPPATSAWSPTPSTTASPSTRSSTGSCPCMSRVREGMTG